MQEDKSTQDIKKNFYEAPFLVKFAVIFVISCTILSICVYSFHLFVYLFWSFGAFRHLCSVDSSPDLLLILSNLFAILFFLWKKNNMNDEVFFLFFGKKNMQRKFYCLVIILCLLYCTVPYLGVSCYGDPSVLYHLASANRPLLRCIFFVWFASQIVFVFINNKISNHK